MKTLLRRPGFLPFLTMIFLNAFVDLGHKIIIQNTVFKAYDGQIQIILIAIVNALILLPFILLWSPAGFIADRFAKPQVMKSAAWVAVALTLVITLSYYQGWYLAAFAMTLLLAVQSAFYSPAKYGYIQQLAGKEQLTAANGIVQAVTIVAILSGIFAFSVMFESLLSPQAPTEDAAIIRSIAPLGWVLVACSALELINAYRLPVLAEGDREQHFNPRDYVSCRYLRRNLSAIRDNRIIWLSIIGLSIFWGVSQVTLAAFPAFAKENLGEMNTVVIQGILASSGIGIMLGSLMAGRASRNRIETGLIPLGALGVVAGLGVITQLDSTVLLAAAFLCIGFFGGLFIIPLNALIQFHAGEHSGNVLAGNNWIQNLTMLTFLGLTVLFATFGFRSEGLFHFIALVALAGALYTVIELPQSMIIYLLGNLFHRGYRVEVHGLDNLPATGGVLLLGNHISWLDWALVQLASPRPVRFVMHKHFYERWYLKWFLDLFGVVPIAPGQSREALRQVNALLKEGKMVCLFPEGSISHTGQLGEFKSGFERTVTDVEGVIIPFYLGGMWGSRFSRCSANLRDLRKSSGRRNVSVRFGTAIDIHSNAAEVKQRVFDLSMESWHHYTESLDPVPLAWIKSVKRRGNRPAIADGMGGYINGYRALTSAILLSRQMAKHAGHNIGLLLPTSSASLIANMATMLIGRTAVNLNYTAALDAMIGAVESAQIETLFTSRKFIQKLEKRGIDIAPLLNRIEVVYLESLSDKITTIDKITTLTLLRLLPARAIHAAFCQHVEMDDTAAILFSSGSEAKPKGVMFSHRGLMSNVKQVSDVLDVRDSDVIMASLPTFHAFGLTVTGIMPLIEGIPVVCHPDPTDMASIAKVIDKHQATVYLSTSTFLNLMTRNRKVEPGKLSSLRVVVAGAEKVRQDVRDAFEAKFDKVITEGYGATETGPVASVNIPDVFKGHRRPLQKGTKQGTVGLPLPGTSFRIVDPETLKELPTDEDGLILVGGPQLMKGYLHDPIRTDEAVIELDGQRWYKTGDKGHLDKDGFLSIVDRYSRFAKIGGEMISLTAVEETLRQSIDDEVEIAATQIADGKKGEKIIALVTGNLDGDALLRRLRSVVENPLLVPATIYTVEAIPKLGSGKNDFKAIQKLAQTLETQ